MLKKRNKGIPSIWECDVCKTHFEIENYRINPSKHHFCSKECRLEWSKKVDSKRVIEWVKNNYHPNSRGGIGITTDGYLWLKVTGKGYLHNQIKLHRYLMQIKLGRELLSTEIVHHKNGNKFDNWIENLEIVTKAQHNSIHKHRLGGKKSEKNKK